MDKYTFASILIFAISIQLTWSQTVSISNSSQIPIPHVVVYNMSETIHLLTNEEGIVDLSEFSDDETIIFQHPSYIIKKTSSKTKLPQSLTLQDKVITIDELVISATRGQSNTESIPYFVKTVQPKSIEFKNAPTAADILISSGHIAIQKTQGGGGSPILRGFEANRILLVIDGIRMNNAIYRSGHLQNSITIDPNILESTEVIFGPSSVMYGSDALGGVIHYISKKPKFAYNSNSKVEARASIQGMSATNSFRTNVNFNIGKKRWASLSSISYSKFGDITMGNNRKSDTTPSDWGKVYHYAQTTNGVDLMVENESPNIQKRTAYSQYDFLQKFRFKTSDHNELDVNAQYSTSTNINRFDQLSRYNSEGTLQYADFYYGPQQRLLTAITNKYTKRHKLFNSINTILAFQNIKEDRHSRKFGHQEQLNQFEKVNIASFNLDFEKELKVHTKLNYGLEYTYNNISSTANYTKDGASTHPAASRYPNGGSQTNSLSAYINYNKKLNGLLHLNTGLRYGFYNYNSTFLPNHLFTPPVSDFSTNNHSPSGSIGLVFAPGKGWRINTNITSGYRVPNVDDYGKIRAKNTEISLPNTNLKPEKALNIEVSATKVFANNLASINLTYFHTYLKDAIVRTTFSHNGIDSIMYDGDKYRMTTNSNAQNAIIKGASANVQAQPFKNTKLTATYNYTFGQVSSTNEPLGHIPPTFGRCAIAYKFKKLSSECYINYQGLKKLEDMSPYGEDNQDEAADIGFPSWETLNIAFQYPIYNNLNLQASVENILDTHYRTFASTISAPGRNFIITLSGKF